MNKKLLIGIEVAATLIILAALLGKYIGYDVGYERVVRDILQEENDRNWKLYKNQELGLSFGYPSSWGEVDYATSYRGFAGTEKYQPVKTHYLGFTLEDETFLRISPDDWVWTGGEVHSGVFPPDEDSINVIRESIRKNADIGLLDEPDRIAFITYIGDMGIIEMDGLVNVPLPKIKASIIEVAGPSKEEDCGMKTEIDGASTVIPSKSCYDNQYIQDLIRLVRSIKRID